MMIGRIIGLLLVRFQRNSLSASFTTFLILPQSVIFRSRQESSADSHDFLGMFHQILGFPYIDKSSGHDIRSCKNHIAVTFQCHDYDHDAVLSQMLTVTKHDVSDITNTKSVYKDRSCLYGTCHLCAVFIHFQNIAGCQDKDIFFRDSQDPLQHASVRSDDGIHHVPGSHISV